MYSRNALEDNRKNDVGLSASVGGFDFSRREGRAVGLSRLREADVPLGELQGEPVLCRVRHGFVGGHRRSRASVRGLRPNFEARAVPLVRRANLAPASGAVVWRTGFLPVPSS